MKDKDFDPFDIFGAPGTEWGKLKMKLKTCPETKYLEASEEIISLAKDVLPEKELDFAENIAKMLAGTRKSKELARNILMKLVSPRPKRPLFYLRHHLNYLPHWTRDPILHMGSYVDVLVKEMAFELSGDRNCLRWPLGKNLNRIKSLISPELYDRLSRYNKFLYVPAKHDFEVPPEREHRFTPREVVLAIFVGMKLASEIKNISKMALEYSERG
jgi:hypothetical protein